MDHYLKWYVDHSPEKQPKSVGRIRGEWRLTIDEKKRILTEHIFGVDIDRQAVEVTKLSLLLKVLEGENEESLQMRLFTSERALPNLDANIKCGNSLIGPDYFAGQLVPNEDDLRRINPFDWKQEFPEAMKSGGFDIVIGNPPYIRSQTLESEQRAYFGHKYLTATGTYDIYVLFVERALELIDANGKTGFILPNKFFTTDYGEGLRKILGSKKLVERIVDFEDAQVFKGAGTYTTLVFLSHVENISPEYARLGEVYRSAGSVGLIRALSSEIPFAPIALTEDGSRWTLAAGKSGKVLLRIQKKFPSFLTIKPHIFQGLKTSADKIFLLKIEKGDQGSCRVRNDLDEQFNIEHGILMPVLKGERVSRYYLDQSENLYILYPYQIDEDGKSVLIDQSEMAKKFPKTWDYLNRHRKELGERDGGKWAKRPDWYAYARGQNIGTFLGRKILVPYMTKRLRVAPDNEGRLFFVNITTGGYGLRLGDDIYSENYIVGLLNSKLLDHCIQQMTNQFRGGYFAVNKQALERLPFRPIDFANFDEKSSYKRMVDLVDNMLQLHPRLASAKTDHERELIQRQIDATDREIDALVYKLYGLNEKEINIIENQD